MPSPSESTNARQVIGLIGGMSWKSSAEYYRLINEGVRARGSAACIRRAA
jgi:aspartate racemase